MTLVNRVLKRLPETRDDLRDDMIKWSDNSDASRWFYLAVQEATSSHYYKTKEYQVREVDRASQDPRLDRTGKVNFPASPGEKPGFPCYLVRAHKQTRLRASRAVRRICRTYTIRSAAPVKIHEAG